MVPSSSTCCSVSTSCSTPSGSSCLSCNFLLGDSSANLCSSFHLKTLFVPTTGPSHFSSSSSVKGTVLSMTASLMATSSSYVVVMVLSSTTGPSSVSWTCLSVLTTVLTSETGASSKDFYVFQLKSSQLTILLGDCLCDGFSLI